MNEQLIYWKHLEFLLSLFMFLFAYAIKFECEATAWETAWKSHIGIASMFSRVNWFCNCCADNILSKSLIVSCFNFEYKVVNH